jgi:uncharacterized protein YkwD
LRESEVGESTQVGRFALILALAAVLVPAAVAASPAQDRAPASAARVSELPDLEVQVLDAVNQLRRSHGLSALRLSPALSQAALGHSQSMAKRGFFGHKGYDGSAFWQRIKPTYRPRPTAYWGVGENLIWAAPQLSAQDAIDDWMASPPHRKNLLTPAWREVGLGAVRALAAPGVYGNLDVTILTADFGAR